MVLERLNPISLINNKTKFMNITNKNSSLSKSNSTHTSNSTINILTNCTNSAGNKYIGKNISLTETPLIVKTCDQVLYIAGAQILKDYDDCSSKESAFFTMSMYMVNYFKKESASTLTKSILIENMDTLPIIIPGTKKKCLGFSSKVNNQFDKFSICFNDSDTTKMLYSAFMNFMKCRLGDSLKPLTLKELRKVYGLLCQGNKINPKTIFLNNREDLIKEINSNMKEKISSNPYYSINVPGSNTNNKEAFKSSVTYISQMINKSD